MWLSNYYTSEAPQRTWKRESLGLFAFCFFDCCMEDGTKAQFGLTFIYENFSTEISFA
jgi:hypothetical protein